MQIILASGNKHKAREIAHLLAPHSVICYSELIAPIAIAENGATFQENALIKARAVFAALCNELCDDNAIVIADDSGICVDLLGGAPNIFSARYAGANASDGENLDKLIADIKAQGASGSNAHYTAAIAIVSKRGELTTHGFLHGEAITTPRGQNGFGYDPIFVPNGFDRTLGELPDEIKAAISHRAKAIALAKLLL